MNSDYFSGYLSLLLAVMNGMGTVFLYVRYARYIRSIRNMFCFFRADENGDMEVIDLHTKP